MQAEREAELMAVAKEGVQQKERALEEERGK